MAPEYFVVIVAFVGYAVFAQWCGLTGEVGDAPGPPVWRPRTWGPPSGGAGQRPEVGPARRSGHRGGKVIVTLPSRARRGHPRYHHLRSAWYDCWFRCVARVRPARRHSNEELAKRPYSLHR